MFARFRKRKPEVPRSWVDEPYTYKYTLELPPPGRPEPWRQHPHAVEGRVRLLPVEFCAKFADPNQIANNRVRVPEKIEELRRSIAKDGLRVPALMRLDQYGKLRYHDGYHRLTAIQQIPDFVNLPVVIDRVNDNRIKGYGRPLQEEFDFILDFLVADS